MNIDIAKEKPLFITGAKRSGTTLVRKIFNAHPDITIPPPASFYRYFRSHIHTYGDLDVDNNILEFISECMNIPAVKRYWNINESPMEILELLPERSFRGVLTTFYHLYSNKFGTSLWGTKEPTNAFWLREIIEDFPQAKLLLIYRDGRDASLDQAELSWGPMNLYTACMAWKSHVSAMLEAKKSMSTSNYYELYYEKFVKDPEPILKDICRHFQISYEPSMLMFYNQEPEEYMKNILYHKKATQPVTEKYVGIYKNLPLSERQLQLSLLSDILQELGYKLEDDKREIDFWEHERYLDEDRNGSNYVETIEYIYFLKMKRLERKNKRIY